MVTVDRCGATTGESFKTGPVVVVVAVVVDISVTVAASILPVVEK
jgi:hypothetical protein